jgi:hypothetical protein
MPHFTKYNVDPCSSPDITTRSSKTYSLIHKTTINSPLGLTLLALSLSRLPICFLSFIPFHSIFCSLTARTESLGPGGGDRRASLTAADPTRLAPARRGWWKQVSFTHGGSPDTLRRSEAKVGRGELP